MNGLKALGLRKKDLLTSEIISLEEESQKTIDKLLVIRTETKRCRREISELDIELERYSRRDLTSKVGLPSNEPSDTEGPFVTGVEKEKSCK